MKNQPCPFHSKRDPRSPFGVHFKSHLRSHSSSHFKLHSSAPTADFNSLIPRSA